MLSKGKMNILLGLCLVSLTSVGFSSWIIADNTQQQEVSGTINVDNVINSVEYVYLDTTQGDVRADSSHTGISTIKFCETGYLDEDDNITDRTSITAYFKLDISKCNALFGSEYSSLKLTFNLKYANNINTSLNIFSDSSTNTGYRTLASNIYCASYTQINKGTAYGISNKQYEFIVSFTNILNAYRNNTISSIISFSLQYSLFATTGQYFSENIYPCLYGDQVNSFALNVSITGSNS